MSGKLISGKPHVHDFRDDLESTLYILLWVALVFSKVDTTENVSGFLSIVLDPYRNILNYTTKPDFLTGRRFFKDFKFANRPCLDTLLLDLAHLFKFRYEDVPTEVDLELVKSAEHLLANAIKRQDYDLVGYITNSYETLYGVVYKRQETAFRNHEATLAHFKKALEDRSKWPLDDVADKQDTEHIKPTLAKSTLSKRKKSKSSWNSKFVHGGGAKKERSSGLDR